MSNLNSNIFEPGTVKPEEDYLELERLGAKLGIPVPMAYITVETTNPDGSPGTKYHDRSRTWNRNFWNYSYGFLSQPTVWTGTVFGAGSLSIKQVVGTVGNVNSPQTSSNYPFYYMGTSAAANQALIGIVVGTGTTAESFDGSTMATLLASGTTAGTIAYGASPQTTAVYNSGTRVWSTINARTFSNTSGGSIVVAETGIVSAIQLSSGSATTYYLICRDLLAIPQTVLNGGLLTVTYTMSMTFPA